MLERIPLLGGLTYSWPLEELVVFGSSTILQFSNTIVYVPYLCPVNLESYGNSWVLQFGSGGLMRQLPSPPPNLWYLDDLTGNNASNIANFMVTRRLTMDFSEQVQTGSSALLRPWSIVRHRFSKRKGQVKQSGHGGCCGLSSLACALCIRKM